MVNHEAVESGLLGFDVSDEPITASELLSGALPECLARNTRFAPPEGARNAGLPFTGTLNLSGASMNMMACDPRGKPDPQGFTSDRILGRSTTFFPAVSLAFFTCGDHLVPRTQDVVRSRALSGTSSWWDIIVQPGRVWSEPDDPQGWNRAAFPFALVSSLDGELHVGLALFLYSENRVSPVRFQLVQQTAPMYVHYFNAWGVTEASYQRDGIDNLPLRQRTYEQEVAGRLPVAPWSALPAEVTGDLLVQATAVPPDTDPDVYMSALVHEGILYRSDCRTVAGPFPYPDEMRHSIWSATKTAMTNLATLRIAQKYGAGILKSPIAHYLPAARRPGWEDVTFRDLANMSSGRSLDLGDYQLEWNRFLFAPRAEEKTEMVLTLLPRRYQPGEEFNYNGMCCYLLAVALEALFRTKEGTEASIWEMLEREVAQPLGIYHLPNISTLEEDGSRGQPHWDEGYFPTLDELAKLGLLYQGHGAWNANQILNRELVDSVLPTTTPPPQERSPDPMYYLNWRFEKIHSSWLPSMRGYGRNTVTLLPGEKVTIRIGNYTDPTSWPPENHVPPGGCWPPRDFIPEWPNPELRR